MNQIWKFNLDKIQGDVTLPLPEGAEILDVQLQYGEPVLWAKVNASKPVKPRKIVLIFTGEHFPAQWNLIHLATLQMHAVGAGLVIHVFEEVE